MKSKTMPAHHPLADSEIRILFSKSDIDARIETLADEIAKGLRSENWQGTGFVAIAVLEGGFRFSADLLRALKAHGLSPALHFITLQSYFATAQSSGQVNILRDLEQDIQGQNVLIVDDILDSGGTLSFLRALLYARGAKNIKTAIMIEKDVPHVKGAVAEFVGFHCPNCFVVGYGMDFAQHYRDLSFIGVLPEHER